MKTEKEVIEQKAEYEVVVAKSTELLSADMSKNFIHIRPNCASSSGIFLVGDTPFSKEVKGALIAVKAIKNAAFFTKSGEIPKYQDWAQVLFVDEKYRNLKSTLVKTRSIAGVVGLVQSALAKNESPVGISFTMRFADANGKNDKGETFSYKYVTFEKNEDESPVKQMAFDARTAIETGELAFPEIESSIYNSHD